MMRLNLQMFGGRGGSSGGSGGTYQRTDTPHTVTLNNGNGSFTAQSYGEGWHNGYHVRQTDSVGGEYIDKGTVNGIKVGSSVLSAVKNSGNYSYPEDIKSAKVVMAHKYPNGKVDFNVQVTDKWGSKNRTNFDEADLKKKKRR